jgi:hypothetical protein
MLPPALAKPLPRPRGSPETDGRLTITSLPVPARTWLAVSASGSFGSTLNAASYAPRPFCRIACLALLWPK